MEEENKEEQDALAQHRWVPIQCLGIVKGLAFSLGCRAGFYDLAEIFPPLTAVRRG